MRFLWTYNDEPPNMALDGITPVQQLAMGLEFYFFSRAELVREITVG